MSLEFSIETLEQKKNILSVVQNELTQDKDLDPQIVNVEKERNEKKLKDLEKGINLLKAANS